MVQTCENRAESADGRTLIARSPGRKRPGDPTRNGRCVDSISSRSNRRSGITLIELLIVIALISVLTAIGVPSYRHYIDGLNISKVIADIKTIEVIIVRFESDTGELPDSLAEAGVNSMRDPWDNPYRYLRIEGAGLKGKGKLRKDKNLVPVNSDYDLYSMGKDGDTKAPFTAKAARDDIVRCRNGQYIGLAKDY